MNLETPEQICEAFNVDRQWLIKHCRKGAIPHVRMGKHYRFERGALDRWIEEHMVNAAAAPSDRPTMRVR